MVTADSELSHAKDSPAAFFISLPSFPLCSFQTGPIFQSVLPTFHRLRHNFFLPPSLPAFFLSPSAWLHQQWQPERLTSTRCTTLFSLLMLSASCCSKKQTNKQVNALKKSQFSFSDNCPSALGNISVHTRWGFGGGVKVKQSVKQDDMSQAIILNDR